ncbi:MAG: PEP-CTERM sorting domain-containing protein [Gemmatimonadales bacterium]|nr:PEP-CTERM sorting domain-containing protein [Gemmatimonadales bacterium]
MRMRKIFAAAGLVTTLAAGQAAAQTPFSYSIPEFDGTLNTSGFPISFNWFNLGNNTGLQFFSVTLSGTFGNSSAGSSAGTDLFFGNILVAQCVQFAACYTSVVPWTYTLTAGDLASLNVWMQTNALTGTAVQTSPFFIRLGQTSIRGTYGAYNVTPVPEPATVGLMALGLVGVGVAGYRRRKQAK